MARLRFVQDPARLETVLAERRANPKPSDSQLIRIFYETDPEIAAALLPRPLAPAARPEIMIQFSHVVMRPAPGVEIPCANATVGVAATYQGRPGWYVLMMPMEGEWVVIGGRERFGEPKKLADVVFLNEGGKVSASVTRKGVTFLEVEASLAADLQPRKALEHLFCYKALQGIDTGYGFDGDCFLTQLNWDREFRSGSELSGIKVTLRESAHDPIVDVPVRRITGGLYGKGSSIASGEILEKVPGEWLQPFYWARYDENATGGIEIQLKSEALAVA